jgi:diaminohydroxyphosphoribosylaminopyrimidine deaminase/5-amino-6-(5-phosphoribosylamino)uracil reductase
LASQTEHAAMRRALALAVSEGVPNGPNPRVGCVLLAADGTELAAGAHRGAGTPHAEVDALTRLEAADPGAARGATAVVTLEPCNHTGRTGPCARALVDAGVARVVFAQSDPNPLASGGSQTLRAAGIAVEVGLLADEAAAVNDAWTFAMTAGRPMVTWKIAASLDGRSAAADGTSRWITSEPARADVHRLRAFADAVMVGTGTVLADDPQLTARAGGSAGEPLPRAQQPLRVVVGRRPLPASSRVLDEAAPTRLMATHDLAAVLADLHADGVRQVLLEGGPTLAGAFVAAGLVDRVVAYVAPVLLGAGPAALGDAGIATISAALRLATEDVTCLGPDVRITARATHRQES